MKIALLLAPLVLLATFSAHAAAKDATPRKLIEFGWDEPDTAFMRTHIAEMEKTPFDGCVFHPRCVGADGKPANMLWDAWGKRAYTEAEIKPAIDDLQATPFHRFTDNFLRFNVSPGEVDWFDDYSVVAKNAELAARIARDGHCAGILFDTEQYDHRLFDYRAQRDKDRKSWDEYARQAHQRGREVMNAFQKGYPGIKLLLTFSFSLPYQETRGDASKLSNARYGLLAPFLNGMLDAANDSTQIIDGFESSYGYRDIQRFDTASDLIRNRVKLFVANPQKYPKVCRVGFGVWVDDDWRKTGWNAEDASKNFYTPEALEKTVRKALETSDEYVWIYTEQPRWWSDAGGSVKLPAAYDQALRRAKSEP